MSTPSPPRLTPDLLARLAQLGVSVGPKPDGTASSSPPRPDVVPLEAAVPGATVTGPHGTCYVTTACFAPGAHHAGEDLTAARAACTASLAALAGQPEVIGLDLARAAFLDLETTGLGVGAGTYAFLVGIGRYVGDAFHVRQLFMRDPSEEMAQLAEAAVWVADCTAVVTFNGRSFDLPLLNARMAMNRCPPLLADVPHLDLLAAARRLWRRRLPSCALTALERDVFGLWRHDDVPGWLIPERYAQYQRTGDARPLEGVFRHNVFDILTMVSLTARLARAYGDPDAALTDGRDWLSLARARERAGDLAGAARACQGALERDLAPEAEDETLEQLARVLKRAGDRPAAIAVWDRIVAAARPRRLSAFEELAKHYEHHDPARDLGRALAHAEQARALVAEGCLRAPRGRAVALAALDHRIARLRRKLERARARASPADP